MWSKAFSNPDKIEPGFARTFSYLIPPVLIMKTVPRNILNLCFDYFNPDIEIDRISYFD